MADTKQATPKQLADEVIAARTAWLESHGVPISFEFARFAEAIGKLSDWASRSGPDRTTQETPKSDIHIAWRKALEWYAMRDWAVLLRPEVFKGMCKDAISMSDKALEALTFGLPDKSEDALDPSLDAPDRSLRSALERVLWNFKLLLAQKPVKEAAEAIAEAENALAKAPDRGQQDAPDVWKHIPKQYKTDHWAFDYDEKNSTFFVHCGGHRICDAEDSEVASAICQAYNAAKAAREARVTVEAKDEI